MLGKNLLLKRKKLREKPSMQLRQLRKPRPQPKSKQNYLRRQRLLQQMMTQKNLLIRKRKKESQVQKTQLPQPSNLHNLPNKIVSLH